MNKSDKDYFKELYDYYDKYKESSITQRRFKHKDVSALLDKLKLKKSFSIDLVGHSVENRPIHLVKVGKGKTKVLLWSQMHGDEATATMAILDVFNFLSEPKELEGLRDEILNSLTLYFLPMLNPDGAEAFKRRNALDIDINRDAIRLQSPESKILKAVRDSLKPEFGFNLHDQNIRYSVGNTGKPATISFLAPPYDFNKSENEVRVKAIKLIVSLNKMLQNYIPGQVGKWNDDFEPRAFGDNIQKWGTSTVLIESGGFKNDYEKQYIRKLNFLCLIHAFKSISDSGYQKEEVSAYYDIPKNERYLFDLLIRDVKIKCNESEFEIDLGIDRVEENYNFAKNFYYKSSLEDMGDLSTFRGYEEFDGKGFWIEPGKFYNEPLEEKALTQNFILNLLKQGYTDVLVKDFNGEKFTKLPLNMHTSFKEIPTGLELGGRANYIIRDSLEVRHAVINGFFYNVKNNRNSVVNALKD